MVFHFPGILLVSESMQLIKSWFLQVLILESLPFGIQEYNILKLFIIIQNYSLFDTQTMR